MILAESFLIIILFQRSLFLAPLLFYVTASPGSISWELSNAVFYVCNPINKRADKENETF